jgi:TonB family protein
VEQDETTEREWRSRLTSDPRDGGVAVGIACALHILLLFALFPAEFRHESREDTARRFGYRGPPNYERLIRVRLLNSGDPVRGAPAQLIGAVASEPDREFAGKVAPLLARARREPKGNAGVRPVYSEGEDPVARLRSTYGNLPTVQSDDVIVRAVVKPDYPQEAVEKGIEGVVVVVAFVNELGEVEDVALEHGVAKVLDTEAVRAAYRTRFEPYLPGGKLQSVFVRIRYNFELVSTLPG